MEESVKMFLIERLSNELSKILLNDFDLGEVSYLAMGMLLSGDRRARNEIFRFYTDRVEIQRNTKESGINNMNDWRIMSYEEFRSYIEQKEVVPF